MTRGNQSNDMKFPIGVSRRRHSGLWCPAYGDWWRECPFHRLNTGCQDTICDFTVQPVNDQSAFSGWNNKTINLSVAFIDWKLRAFVSLFLSTVDSSRESTFGRPSCGEKRLNNPGESRKPDNWNNPSHSPQRILPQKMFWNGASRAFWPHSQTTHLPQSMLRIFSYLLPLNSVRLRSRHHQGWIPSCWS